MISPATIQSLNLTAYTASVQVDGAATTFLKSVPVSSTVSPALLSVGARVLVLIYDDNNPSDALVVGVLPPASPLLTAVACRVYRNAAQSIPNAAQTAISFTTARFDTLSAAGQTAMWAVGDPTKVYCRQPGIYEATLNVEFASNATGERIAAIYEIASNQFVAMVEVAALSGDTTNLNVSTGPWELTGTTGGFQAFVYQNSGGALNIDSVAASSPEFSVKLLR